MSNKPLFTFIAILVVIAAVVVVLAYTYLDIGLVPKGGGTLRVALQSFSAETLDPSLDNKDGLKYHGHMYDELAGVTPRGQTRHKLRSAQPVDGDLCCRFVHLDLEGGRHLARWRAGYIRGCALQPQLLFPG